MHRVNPSVGVTDWTVHESDLIVPPTVKMYDMGLQSSIVTCGAQALSKMPLLDCFCFRCNCQLREHTFAPENRAQS